MSKKEVAPVQNNLPTELTDLGQWGMPTQMSSDIIIPKILPMQGLSELVTDGKAVMGEFRNSLSGEKLGSITDPIEIIPFAVQKVWDIYKQVGDKFEWEQSIPLNENPASKDYNDLLPWADKDADGVNIKRIRRMNFFVLLPSDLAQGHALPFVFSFKSTSYTEGKKIYSQMYMANPSKKLPPPAYTFKIGGTKEKNDHGTFIVPKMELGRLTTADELTQCLYWFKQVSKLRVDEKDTEGGENFGAAQATTGTGDY